MISELHTIVDGKMQLMELHSVLNALKKFERSFKLIERVTLSQKMASYGHVAAENSLLSKKTK